MVFYVNMYFTIKSHFVAGVHQTKPPEGVTYSSAVSRNSVCVVLIFSYLSIMDVPKGDIQ